MGPLVSIVPPFRDAEVGPIIVVIKKHRLSGEVPPSSKVQLSKKEYIARALSQLQEKGLYEDDMGEPEVSRVMIQSVPREGHQGETTEMQKSVLVSFPRIIEVDGIAVKVLGEGSRIAVQLGNDGAPMNTSKIWRQVAPQTSSKGERVPVKPSEAAYEEALKQLENAEQYELMKTDFGYKAESGNVRQEEMAVVYQFVFKPQNGKGEMLPPRMIEIPAI